MNSFTLTQATAIDEALRDKASHDNSAYLGGGTNLIDLMKENVARPTHLTSLHKLPLSQIERAPMAACAWARWPPTPKRPTTPKWKSTTRC